MTLTTFTMPSLPMMAVAPSATVPQGASPFPGLRRGGRVSPSRLFTTLRARALCGDAPC